MRELSNDELSRLTNDELTNLFLKVRSIINRSKKQKTSCVNEEIYFCKFDKSGKRIGGNKRLTNDKNYYGNRKLLWRKKEYSLSYMENINGTPKTCFMRLDKDGNNIGKKIIPLKPLMPRSGLFLLKFLICK